MKVGIDLGTTYSAVAYFDKDSLEATVIPNMDGDLLTPSVIYFDPDGTLLIGKNAKNMQSQGKGTIAASFKRANGDTNYSFTANEKSYSAEDLSAILLKHLISDAELSLGKKIDSAVITVPAYFNDIQRTATVRAGERCGIKVLKIINEPTAGAISYGYNNFSDKIIMVYDLGGGTFDVTLVHIENGNITVIGTDGNQLLGGKDWDNAIITYFCNKFFEDFGFDIRDDEAAKNSLIVSVEELKKELTEKSDLNIHLEYEGEVADYTLTAEQLKIISEPLFASTQEVCERILIEKELSWNDIDEILLVGGSTRLPNISTRLSNISKKPIVKHDDTDLAVVKGAALSSYAFEAEEKSIEFTDVTSHSLGALSVREDGKQYINEIMIKRNSIIPSSVRKLFKIEPGNMTDNIELFTLQGESHRPIDCLTLARMKISGIDNFGDGALVEIEYNYDENGIVGISAFQNNVELVIDSEPLPEDMQWMGERPGLRQTNAPIMKNIVIALDLSRSMRGTPLEKAKTAVSNFVNEVSDEFTRFALIVFGDKTKVVRDLTMDRYAITSSIKSIKVNMAGRGTDATPFEQAKNLFEGKTGANVIIVLTDGIWGNRNRAVHQVMECRTEGISTIAVGFGEADRSFLRQIATVEEGGIFTTLEQLGETFGTIATVVKSSKINNDIRGAL
ncbi:MAG TPA: Hsp70 family protein [Candidatus Methanomethylophilaceae archaeon]|nr:Hsp70 family protein [Candidatus Methanomethylophilaceae archaeon]